MEHHTAAGILSVFKIGDTVLIDGDTYVIEDKVDEGAREKLRIYFGSYEEAKQFGRKICPVYRHSDGPLEGMDCLGEFQVTGYCSCPLCCGEKEEMLTKTETVPKAAHTIAADPSVIPLGTRIVIDGVVYTVEDTGKAVKGNQLVKIILLSSAFSTKGAIVISPRTCIAGSLETVSYTHLDVYKRQG